MPVDKKIKMYYDPRGNVIRTVNPDSSEQWVVYGKPTTLSSIAINNSWSFKNYAPSRPRLQRGCFLALHL